jgi:hypothetical protein
MKESEFDAVSICGVKAKLETEKVHKANKNKFFMMNPYCMERLVKFLQNLTACKPF